VATDIKKLREDVAKVEADRESRRFDPQFLDDLRAERDRQIGQWGGDGHDSLHNPYDWTVFLTKFVGRAAAAAMDGDDGEFERTMVKIAALAAAAKRSMVPPAFLASEAERAREDAAREASR
jgi:hypothetical protein